MKFLLGSKWRHVKCGTIYTVIACPLIQDSTCSSRDGKKAMVYVDDDGGVWTRDLEEFMDGRFESVSIRPFAHLLVDPNIDISGDVAEHLMKLTLESK